MISNVSPDPYVQALFLAEAQDSLQMLEQALLVLEKTPPNRIPDHFQTLLRLAHSFKGSASMVNAVAVVGRIHVLEEGLGQLQHHWITLSAQEQKHSLSQLLQCTDGLQQALTTMDQGMSESMPDPLSLDALPLLDQPTDPQVILEKKLPPLLEELALICSGTTQQTITTSASQVLELIERIRVVTGDLQSSEFDEAITNLEHATRNITQAGYLTTHAEHLVTQLDIWSSCLLTIETARLTLLYTLIPEDVNEGNLTTHSTFNVIHHSGTFESFESFDDLTFDLDSDQPITDPESEVDPALIDAVCDLDSLDDLTFDLDHAPDLTLAVGLDSPGQIAQDPGESLGPDTVEEGEDLELLHMFFQETREFQQILRDNLNGLLQGSDAQRTNTCFRELYRATHSLKGSCSMFGRLKMAEIALGLENQVTGAQSCWTTWDLQKQTQWLDSMQMVPDLLDEALLLDEQGQDPALMIQGIDEILGQMPELSGVETAKSSDEPTLWQTLLRRDLPPLIKTFHQLSQVGAHQVDIIQQRIPDVLELLQTIISITDMLQLEDFQNILATTEQTTSEALFNESQLSTLPDSWSLAVKSIEMIRQSLVPQDPIQSNRIEGLMTAEVKDDLSRGDLAQDDLIEDDLIAVSSAAGPSFTRVDSRRLETVMNSVGELVIQRTYLDQQRQDLGRLIRQSKQILKQIQGASQGLREAYDQLSIRGSVAYHDLNFDTLEWDRYTTLHESAHSLMETSFLLREKLEDLTQVDHSIDQIGARFNRICGDLSDQAMRLRVAPFSQAIDHLPRAIHDLCQRYNKSVDLILYGRNVEIDELILNQLRDPLTHLVRNAFDHGIESSEERKAHGKVETGQIEIEARHDGSHILITVRDDGGGINPEAVRRKAVDQGLYSSEAAQGLSETELHRLLFVPEFSTADKVTELSGRGVGLDIVERVITQLRGRIDIETVQGQGTTFLIRLPLVLSIIPAILVRTDRDVLAIPQDQIHRMIRIPPEDLSGSGQETHVRWQDQTLPVLKLPDLLTYHTTPKGSSQLNPLTIERFKIPIIILQSQRHRQTETNTAAVAAIVVDQLIGQQDIVLKALPPVLPKPIGISGAATLGTGQVVLVLDTDELVEQAQRLTDSPTAVPVTRSPSTQPRILVVDDAYSVRQMLASTLTRAGFQVDQAQDGRVAISRLTVDPDYQAIITDLEMPRVDGFGLLRHLQTQPQLAEIPTIVLTSRSATKHRDKAVELNANAYLTKPFQKQALVSLLQLLLAES